jgi:hypothetical protein
LIFICESLADRTLLMKDMAALMRGESVQASSFVRTICTDHFDSFLSFIQFS